MDMQLIRTRDKTGKESREATELSPPPEVLVDFRVDSQGSLDPEGFWLNQFAESPPPLELPLDHLRTPALSQGRAKVVVTLDAEMVSALQEVGKRYDCPLFVVLFAGFTALMHRLSGQDDLVLAASFNDALDGQPHGNSVAHQANELLLRSRAESNPRFSEYLGKMKWLLETSMRNQDHFSGSILEELTRRGDSFPFPTVLFNYDGPGRTGTVFEDEHLENNPARQTGVEIPRPEICFGVSGQGGSGIDIDCEYAAHLWRPETIQRWLGHFRTFLKGVCEDPESPLWEMPILTEFERQTIVVDWNRTEREFPADSSITAIFEKRAAASPESVAIRHNTKTLTYRELNERANQMSRLLCDAGAGPGSLIGICLDRSPDLIVGILAILKAGATYIPISSSYPEARRSLMLEGASLILTSKELFPNFVRGKVRVIDVENLDLSGLSAANPPQPSDGESTLTILYTSGSTGIPKGVKIVHRAVTALVLNTNYIQFEPTDAVAFRANIGFDVALFEIWGPLLNGARIIVIDQEVQLSPTLFVSEMKRNEVTILWITTSLFHFLAMEMPTAFSGLRQVFVGGEILNPESVRAVLKQDPPQRLANVYGPTETTTFSTTYGIEFLPEDARTIPIGKPIANTKVYLLDRRGAAVPIGVVGEIHIGGAGLANGYLNAKELTLACFIQDPFSKDSDARLYRTGDLARWLPDGSIDYVGRVDNQVKIRGFRVETAEIELALKQYPSVRDAVVIVQEREIGDKRLVAYVAGEPTSLSEDEIHDFLKSKLPDHALPSAIVVMKTFPFNRNGKIDRQALPDSAPARTRKEVVSPRDAVERQLQAIWEKVLRLEPISVTDDFFRLGGHSLQAARLFMDIERSFGKSFPLASLLETPTIERLAEKIRKETLVTDWAPVVTVNSSGARIPFFGIHGRDGNVLFYRNLSEYLGSDQPFYALQSQGLDGQPMIRNTVEEMAEYYIEEIRKIRPRGPYLLGGFSFGGVIAYEIARRLRLAGEEIPLVVLFDTLNPAVPPKLRSLAGRIRQRIIDPSSITFTRLFQFLARRVGGERGATLLRWNETFHKLILGWKAKNERETSLELIGLHIRMVHERAFHAYKPLQYDGRITLFRASIQPEGYESEADLGWSRFAQGGVVTHFVPGDHDTLFSDENVPALAKKLEECIKAA